MIFKLYFDSMVFSLFKSNLSSSGLKEISSILLAPMQTFKFNSYFLKTVMKFKSQWSQGCVMNINLRNVVLCISCSL